MEEQNANYAPPTQPVQSTSPLDRPKKTIPTFIGIAIIVVVALVLFGGVFAWQYFAIKNNQIAGPALSGVEGWKTYTNTQYGFQFDYPEAFGELKNNDYPYIGGLSSTKALLSSRAEDGSNKYSLSIGVADINLYKDSNTGGSITSYDLQKGECSGDKLENYEKYNAFLFNGLKGCYIGDADGGGVVIGYLIPNRTNQQIIEIKIIFSGEIHSVEDGLQILNQIISTFKFTTPIDQTTGWKTYTNAQYGFEIKYPQGYSAEFFNGSIRFPKDNDETVWNGFEIKLITLQVNESCSSEIYAKSILTAGDSIYEQAFLPGINQDVEQVKNSYGSLSPILLIYIPMEDCLVSRNIIRISGSEKYLNDYNNFLSTFKFTTSNQTVKPSITIISPNGGEQLSQNQTYNITWRDNVTTSDNIVKIVLNAWTGSGVGGGTIITQTVDAGSYQWNISQTINGMSRYGVDPGNYKIGMCKGNVCDFSDNYFTITK